MFYGWGTKSKQFPMQDGQTAVLVYKYVSLMFIFQQVTSREWHLVGRDRAADRVVTKAELEAAYGDVPDLPIWKRFGLLMFIATIVLIGVVGSLFS